jgi:hypothetical protein
LREIGIFNYSVIQLFFRIYFFRIFFLYAHKKKGEEEEEKINAFQV